MPDTTNLPYEYQSQIEAETRRQALAQAMLQQSLGFKGAQSTGRIAAKTPTSAWLANALTTYLTNKTASDAGAKIGEVRGQAQTAENADVGRILGMPEDQQVNAATQSPWARSQALAKVLAERQQKRVQLFAETTKDGDLQGAGQAAATGRVPSTYTAPGMKPTEFGQQPGGSPYAITYDRKGQPTLRFEPKAPTITNQIPGDVKAGAAILEEDLKPRRDAADAAKTLYSATSRAVDALQRGAQAGGLEKGKQLLRTTLQGLGITVPATAETSELQMALGNALLTEAAKIKPISNTDIDTLREIVGQISTDPTALSRALAFSQAGALDALHNFGKYVDEQSATMKDPIAMQRLAGVKIGREVPKSLFGPTEFQLEVMRQMQNSGQDISRFNDPTGVPFAQNSQFKINPAGGFPVGNAPAKTPQPVNTGLPPPKNGTAYTIEEALAIPALADLLRKKMQGQ